jgi:hypothetical protein
LLQFAKAGYENPLLVCSNIHISEHQNLVIEPGLLELSCILGVNLGAEIDPADLGADRGIHRLDFDAHDSTHLLLRFPYFETKAFVYSSSSGMDLVMNPSVT